MEKRFRDYLRHLEKLDFDVEEINLRTNYRSSENIISHCNQFVELDNEFQHARVEDKPKSLGRSKKR